MKILWQLLPSAAQAICKVIIFFVSLGWVSYGAILVIVKAEGQSIRREALAIRGIDKAHFDEKIDGVENRMNFRFDRVERILTDRYEKTRK